MGSFRRVRPPSAMTRAMWPKVPTSSPWRAKIEPLLGAGQAAEVVPVGVAHADGDDLDPLAPGQRGLLARRSRRRRGSRRSGGRRSGSGRAG